MDGDNSKDGEAEDHCSEGYVLALLLLIFLCEQSEHKSGRGDDAGMLQVQHCALALIFSIGSHACRDVARIKTGSDEL